MGKANNTTTTGSETAELAEAVAAPDVLVTVEVIDQSAIINGCHHARGKLMELPESKAAIAVSSGWVKLVGV